MSLSENEVGLSSYFDDALVRFVRAEAQAVEVVTRYFRIAGQNLAIRFAGKSLVPMVCPAFEHLEIDPTVGQTFTINCWEQATTRISMPPRPWGDSENFSHGEIPSHIDADRYLHINHASGAVVVADRRKNLATFWVRSSSEINTYEIAAPFRDFLNWWGSVRGLFQIHAGAVGYPDGGALLVGRSGAGKSNTTLACLQSDMLYLSDDCCLLDTAGEPFLHGIYNSAKIYRSDLDRYPIFGAHRDSGIPTPENKALFFLNRISPERVSAGFPLKVMLVVRVADAPDTNLSPISPAAVLLTMGPDNILRWPVVGRSALSSLAEAVRKVPCHYLNVGADRSRIPGTIAAAIGNS